MSVSKNNTSNQILASNGVFNGLYDDVSTYAQICVSLNTNTKYKLTINYSVNGISVDYSEDINVTSRPTETVFYNFVPKEKYFSLSFQNTDSIQQNTMFLQTIYKNSLTTTGSGVGSNVSIVSPVNGDGYVQVYVKNSDVVVSGSVNVDNFPASQVISGSVNVDNFPASQVISGSVNVDNFPASQVISGSVNVDNFPASQVISGSVNVDNFPASQVISGSVNVDNFPTTQAISNDDIGTIATSLNNQRKNVVAWNNVSVVQNGVSNVISPGTSTYCNTTLSCYGTSSQNATIAVQFSQDNITYYTTQYQYTVTAGDFGFSITCSAYNIRLILLSATTSAISAFIDIC
jgi:hypothetical protein